MIQHMVRGASFLCQDTTVGGVWRCGECSEVLGSSGRKDSKEVLPRSALAYRRLSRRKYHAASLRCGLRYSEGVPLPVARLWFLVKKLVVNNAIWIC